MLDTDTKRRIDSARDILVGKLPDPKSQVEQITIALIYKFMDDMDARSEELGGERTFFDGDFQKYGWARLMRGGLGGHEMLGLYSEAITRMPENPGIPPLFRDIFKNAYLPYRDPETLRAFLKVIDDFEYDHSERLGDAFEYLLSVLGSQGDAGQFRTPRHIIDFIVSIVDPKKGETVLDPACGTAGFLISAYKHILKANTDANGNTTLTPDDRERLAANFRGYDISPDMVRLSLVNMYLHGFADPQIHEYDTLSSQDRWIEHADVILANPPFMSPRGGIQPHNRFSVQSKRSEVLFVDYMAEHLRPDGRAGIIVPEGVIFQSQTAYRQLRKLLVEESLVAVISLPAGVFNPYSGVKTSILILDKALAKQSATIGFFKITNDGFGLGAQRRTIDKNDLPQAHAKIAEYLRRLRGRESVEDFAPTPGLIVGKDKIAANGDYNLSGERYREGVVSHTPYPLVPVGRFMKVGVTTVDPRNSPDERFELWSIPAFDAGSPQLLRGGDIGSQKKVVAPGDVLLSRIIPHIRRGWVVRESAGGLRQIASTEWIVFSSDEVVPGYLRQLLLSDAFHVPFMQTITGVGGSLSRANVAAVAEIPVPLPPLEEQREIMAEIEGYEKVIDGARAVLDNYRPHIPISPDWPEVALSAVCESIADGDHQPPPKANDGVPFITIRHMSQGGEVDFANTFHVPRQYYDRLSPARKPREGDVLYSVTGSYGISVLVPSDIEFCFQRHIALIRPGPSLDSKFLLTLLQSPQLRRQADEAATGVAQKTVALKALREFRIPLPPLSDQQLLMVAADGDRALVNANRELISRYTRRIQAGLARVWGRGDSSPAVETSTKAFVGSAVEAVV